MEPNQIPPAESNGAPPSTTSPKLKDRLTHSAAIKARKGWCVIKRATVELILREIVLTAWHHWPSVTVIIVAWLSKSPS